MICILEGIQQIKAWSKAQTKKVQVWTSKVISVLPGFSFLPSYMSPDQPHLKVPSGVILQTNKPLFTFLGSIVSLWGLESQREKKWQFEQVAKQNRETDKATNSGTSVMHWLSIFHMWKLVSLRSDICISVKASRDAELHCTAWLKKVYSKITEYLNKVSYLTNKALFFLSSN